MTSLFLQLDADVAEKTYASGSIDEAIQDLPCGQPCPPPSASTDPAPRRSPALEPAETSTPPMTVLCTPSKSMEAWVVAALYPDDLSVKRGIECWPDAESRLSQQPAQQRIKKSVSDYASRGDELRDAWPRLVRDFDEPRRFDSELRASL